MNQPAVRGSSDGGDERHPTRRFSERVGEYVRHRPDYPPGMFELLLEGLGPASGLVAVDIGAGTGISSRPLAARGCRVIAVEPNADMRAAGMAAGGAGIEWRGGTGEATGLDAGTVDVVLCAQAFHWLDAGRAMAEFARITRRGGRVGVVWNVRDDRDAFTSAYGAAIVRHATEPPTSPSMSGHDRSPFPAPGWEGGRRVELAWQQELDEAGLIGRALSASYVPRAGAGRVALEAELRAAFARWGVGGRGVLRYVTCVHLAERGEERGV
ncbi:MAG: class I SAM-dependent methyltransferase [Planctomycetota bacterium]|nr:class I SAM-dependent methyltransferase [Planctomycetota bacterium]